MASTITNETLQELVDYYVNLLIIQYNNKPKAREHIALLIQEVIASGIVFEVRDGYDLETAVGAQLDVIGLYVGVTRSYNGINFGDGVFAFVEYDESEPYSANKKGFATYSDVNKAGETFNYDKSLGDEFQLDDESYRTLIKLKIIQNNINHSHESIDNSIFQFFGTDVVADSPNNMTMFYFIPKSASTIIEVAVQKGLLPKPMGVGLDYIIKTDEPLFGMATYNSSNTVKSTGFATYADIDVKAGAMLNYNKLMEA